MSHTEHESAPYGIAPPGFRLPAGTAVGVVRLQVADLDRSLGYYREVLGFRTAGADGATAALAAADGAAPLIELRERPGARPASPEGRPGLYHYAVLLPDRADIGRFMLHLAEVGEPAGASDHLVSEALYLRDPDGHGIEVYADRPRSEWRHRDRELVMTTDPLDRRNLATAAGDRRWEGVPHGTTIGHVHLHVGDLARASSFYHDGLGLDRVVWSYPGALFLSAGGYHHHVGLNTWARGGEPPEEGDARLLDWELRLPSEAALDGALRSLRAAGHDAHREPGGLTARDPWGTTVRITTGAAGA